MIVVMKQGASQEQISHMIQRVESLGLKAHVIHGTERTVIAAIGDKRDEYRTSLERGPRRGRGRPHFGSLQSGQPGGQARTHHGPRGAAICRQLPSGRDRRALLGGERGANGQHRPSGQGVGGHGAARRGLQGRAPAPYSFQGLKEEGLKILATARAETGLPVVTEVISTRTWSWWPVMLTSSRSAPATCRTTGCWKWPVNRAVPCC